jgi:ATP-binding cassette subfamily B protein
MMVTLLPFMLAAVLASVAASLLVGGWAFSPKAIRFKPERINPVKGSKNLISMKSLVNLLVRFYDPTAGFVHFNGIDCATIPASVLRNRIALVMQDPFLFTGTLQANIFFAANGLSPRQQADILDASRCQDLVARFPDGLNTQIMEGGASLSSGERQLVSVARAFASDPEVIILDEATSYVDSQTEVHLQQAIANLMHGRTCVVVAHRLTTARTADRIVVLNNGVMVETGSHAALMARRGYYYRLYQLQGS